MPELITPQGDYSIAAILFDKDGTLLQFVSLWGSWGECFLVQFARQLEQRSLKFPAQHLASLLGTVHDAGGKITDYDRNGPLAMGTMSDLYAILSWQGYLLGLSWAESMELVDACRQEADAMLERSRPVLPLPGLLQFLDDCAAQDIPLAVVTADETDAAENHLRWLGIRGYFSAVIGTDQVEQGKPFADMALLACERLGIQPGEAAVIGDTNGDMRMAKAAGAAVAIGIAGAAVAAVARPAAGPAGSLAGVGEANDPADTAGASSRAADTRAVRGLLPDADCIVQSYAELSIGRIGR
jgi:phosphoglycolate phosphatase